MTTIRFPREALSCLPGDYLIHEVEAGRWTVHLVQQLVLLSRLVPFHTESGLELLEDRHAADSAPPWRMGEVHVLMTPFVAEFPSAEACIQAIAASALGGTGLDVCVPVVDLRREQWHLYRPAEADS